MSWEMVLEAGMAAGVTAAGFGSCWRAHFPEHAQKKQQQVSIFFARVAVTQSWRSYGRSFALPASVNPRSARPTTIEWVTSRERRRVLPRQAAVVVL